MLRWIFVTNTCHLDLKCDGRLVIVGRYMCHLGVFVEALNCEIIPFLLRRYGERK